MSFLPVGHTHEDIDQMFSRFSHKLKINPPRTIPELIYTLPRSYANLDANDIEVVDNVVDLRSWLSHCPPLHGITEYQVLTLWKNDQGNVVCRYKLSMHDEVSRGGRAVVLGVNDTPCSLPRYVHPIVLNVAKIKSSIESSKEWLVVRSSKASATGSSQHAAGG